MKLLLSVIIAIGIMPIVSISLLDPQPAFSKEEKEVKEPTTNPVVAPCIPAPNHFQIPMPTNICPPAEEFVGPPAPIKKVKPPKKDPKNKTSLTLLN